MAKAKRQDNILNELPLAKALSGEVRAWQDQGYPGVTQTTYHLLSYWFQRDEEAAERFYNAQREAIETVIYCYEILGGQFRIEERREMTLKDLYERVAPEVLPSRLGLVKELESISFMKYALKMATGSGKTWVLAALLVWQYFNAMNGERPGQYSFRCMVVTPGLEVKNRILDSFKGKQDKNGNRQPETSDYQRNLFIPDAPEWRGRFHLEIYEPDDLRANTTMTDGPFVYITNWQQFVLRKGKRSLWVKYTGEDVEEAPRGEVIIDQLTEFPDLMVMNDEAHHVHGKMTARGDELVWRRFMAELDQAMAERHGKKRGMFMQVDFSATPFFGAAKRKEYFPHIVYDYPLLSAMNDMLVKQLWLEERQAIGGEKGVELRVTAEREEEEGRKRGRVTGLSEDQMLLLEIGRKKLEQLTQDFKAKAINKKPVMMVLCEDTTVADYVVEHMDTLSDETGDKYDDSKVLALHSEMKDADLAQARTRLNEIDEDDAPLRVVVSVLMLREGFDKDNICVTVVLRSAKADLLLEQIVGRGLRLMFPKYKYPQYDDAKREAHRSIRENRIPNNALDFLFVVEHPRFREFYEELRREGYAIGEGDTSERPSAGDLIPVYAETERRKYDLAWPVQVYETGKLPEFDKIELAELPPFNQKFSDLKKWVGKLAIQETHAASGKKGATWKLENEYFDFNYFLSRAADAVATSGKKQLFTGRKAEIAALIDDYVTARLFREKIDFTASENYQVLNFVLVYNHVVDSVRKAIQRLMGEIQYTPAGKWAKLSDIERIDVREKTQVAVERCIYPVLPTASVGGGFERLFINEVLEPSAFVLAHCKLLERRHKLCIRYRDQDGIERDYYPDFIIKTVDRVYLVETKMDKETWSRNVGLKAQATVSWCQMASTVPPEKDTDQPQDWEYLLIPERLVKEQAGLGFEALVPQAQALTNEIVARLDDRLFRD